MTFLDEFKTVLENKDRKNAVRICLERLTQHKISVLELYKQLLIPAMDSFGCCTTKECELERYQISLIMRTVIECCYPYLESSRAMGAEPERVLILCPEGDFHESYARIWSDYFEMSGFSTLFMGGNVSHKHLKEAMDTDKFQGIVFVVSKCFSLFTVSHMISMLKDKENFILVGPSLFRNLENHNFLDAFKTSGAKNIIWDFEDIQKLVEKGVL